jgi:hypothetical protein
VNSTLRKIWSLGWRLGIAAALMAWALHATFHDQCRTVLESRGIALDALPRIDRWIQVWRLGPSLLLSTLVRVSPGWLALSVALWGLTIVLGAWRWWIVLRSQGLDPGFRRTLEISFVAHFFNSFLLGSTGGDVLKAYYAARVTRQLKTEAVTSVLIDRVLGLFTMLAFSAVMLLPNLSLVRAHNRTLALATTILAMTGAAGILLLVSLRGGLSQVVPGARNWIRRLPKADVLERGLAACRTLGRKKSLLAQTLAVSILLTVTCVFQLQTLVWGYGDQASLTPMFLIVPAVICVSALPLTPNGLGVRDYLYLYLLSLPEIGINSDTAVAISLVAYAASLVWSVLGGILYVFMRREISPPGSLG